MLFSVLFGDANEYQPYWIDAVKVSVEKKVTKIRRYLMQKAGRGGEREKQ
jgi:hypothetical protein